MILGQYPSSAIVSLPLDTSGTNWNVPVSEYKIIVMIRYLALRVIRPSGIQMRNQNLYISIAS